MTSKKKRRIFSRGEANALLPELAQRLKRLQHKKEIYRRMHDNLFMHELVCVAEKTHGFLDPQDDLETGIHALEEAIEELAKDVEAIFATGAILRNIEKGHVDLPGELDGQKIYFLWAMGDPQIRFYRLRGDAVNERREFPAQEVPQ